MTASLSPKQIKLIKWSFAEVYFSRDAAAKLFYDRLFAIAPQTRALFKTDMEAQGRKLMDTLSLAVTALGNPESLPFLLQDTARRHLDYGAKPEHYAAVGVALLWMLEQHLGEDFSPELRLAWTQLYQAVAETMQSAAKADAG